MNWARQQVQERIAGAEVPTDARPSLGALSSVIGEVYRYTLWSPTMPLVELKALQDWALAREFLKVAGVADVISYAVFCLKKQRAGDIRPGRNQCGDGSHRRADGFTPAR